MVFLEFCCCRYPSFVLWKVLLRHARPQRVRHHKHDTISPLTKCTIAMIRIGSKWEDLVAVVVMICTYNNIPQLNVQRLAVLFSTMVEIKFVDFLVQAVQQDGRKPKIGRRQVINDVKLAAVPVVIRADTDGATLPEKAVFTNKKTLIINVKSTEPVQQICRKSGAIKNKSTTITISGNANSPENL